MMEKVDEKMSKEMLVIQGDSDKDMERVTNLRPLYGDGLMEKTEMILHLEMSFELT